MRYRILLGLIILISTLLIGREVLTNSSTSDEVTPADIAQQLAAAFSRGEAADLDTLVIPALPFDDNPDPTLCGIPTPYGTRNNTAWLSGVYDGELIQSVVYLYRDHLRDEIVALGPHGTEVEVVLYQSNPQLDYFMVRIPSAPEGQREGWVPAPFLSFDPIG